MPGQAIEASDLMTEDTKPFVVHCGKCGHEWTFCHLPISLGVFVKILKNVCPSCGARQVFAGPQPKPTADGDVIGWLTNGDTGTSSLTIYHVMIGRPHAPNFWPNVPADAGDFGRCYRLLKVMPSWRARLPEVAATHPSWLALVEAWDELTALFEQESPSGRYPKLSARMRQLRGDRV